MADRVTLAQKLLDNYRSKCLELIVDYLQDKDIRTATEQYIGQHNPSSLLQRTTRQNIPDARHDLHTPQDRAQSRPPRSGFLHLAFHQQTFIAVLLLHVLVSGMMLAFSIQQNREPACVPQRDRLHTDDGFWMLLSQLFLQFLSVYTTLYPVVRDHDEKIRIAAFWFRSLLGISVMTSIMATVVYSSSWKVATVLSFFSGFAATISAAQLAVGLDASVKDKGN